jgi:hypothetical protein
MTAGRPSVPIDTQPTVDRAAQCVSTDPAWRPISVHRAVNCPDGTLVTVQGILVHDAHRATTLCDVVTATGDRCVGDELSLKGAVDSPVLAAAVGKVIFTGVLSGHVLQLVSPLARRESVVLQRHCVGCDVHLRLVLGDLDHTSFADVAGAQLGTARLARAVEPLTHRTATSRTCERGDRVHAQRAFFSTVPAKAPVCSP